MRTLTILLLIVAMCIASRGLGEEKKLAEESKPSSFQPKPLDDEWSKWLVGEWESTADSDAGTGEGRTKMEFGLNGQFLIMNGEFRLTELTDEQRQYLRETLSASDEEIEEYRRSTFKVLQVQTIDPKTGETIGYLFDSMRCIAAGRGRRQGNKETIEWIWSGHAQGATSVTITERTNDNKFTLNHKYSLPNGKKMEDKVEMTRPTMAKQDEDTAAVKQFAEKYAAAWAKGDPELLLSCYADDAVVIMSLEEPIVGKQALRELYQHVFAAQKTEEEGGGMASMADAMGLNPEDYTWTTKIGEGTTEVSGDLGYLWSTYANIATPKPGVDAESIRDSGVSLLIVRRQKDGAWKVALRMSTRGEDPVAASQQNETTQE